MIGRQIRRDRGARRRGMRLENFADGARRDGGGGIGGCTAWNSRGAAAKCSCAAAGLGNSGLACGGIATRGAAACGGLRRGAAAAAGGGATGAARTVRRSPSIIARRSTTWPSVL